MSSNNRDVSLQMSPAPATTAEEAMAPSGERTDSRQPIPDLMSLHRPSSVNTRESSGMAANGREESGAEAEPWAAAIPPVRCTLITFPDMKSLHEMIINHKELNE